MRFFPLFLCLNASRRKAVQIHIYSPRQRFKGFQPFWSPFIFAVFCPFPPTHDFLYVYFSAVQNVGKSENFAASFLLNSSITCVYTFIVISALACPILLSIVEMSFRRSPFNPKLGFYLIPQSPIQLTQIYIAVFLLKNFSIFLFILLTYFCRLFYKPRRSRSAARILPAPFSF